MSTLVSLGIGWTDEEIFVDKAEFPGLVRYVDDKAGGYFLHAADITEYAVRIEAFYIGSVSTDGLFERESNGDRVFEAWWRAGGCGDIRLGDGSGRFYHFCEGTGSIVRILALANRWAHELLNTAQWHPDQ